MVFQSYALYPHMTAFENMAFGLKLSKTDKSTIREKVTKAAMLLELQPLLERKPKQLSGGQRQRVAIGRAIVRDPKVFLFDEPLSNLDASLRVQTRLEIAALHAKMSGVTMIYVTHDQVEAMTLADRICVLRDGRVEQVGTPRDLFERPINEFVAGFIGSPKMNFLRGSFAKGFECPSIGVRPEHLKLEPAHSGLWQGTIVHEEYLGTDRFVFVNIGAVDPIVVKLDDVSHAPPIGSQVGLSPVAEFCHRFDTAGAAIR